MSVDVTRTKRRYKDMTGFRNHTKFCKTDNRDREEIKEIRRDNRVQDRQQIPNRLQRPEEVMRSEQKTQIQLTAFVA